MHTRMLGQGLQVSAIGLGAMGMSPSYGPNPGDRQAMITVLRDAVDLGITFVDTAESYGPYVNEELIGEALAPVREQVVIATKFGWRIQDGRSTGLDSRPEQISGSLTPHRRLIALCTGSLTACTGHHQGAGRGKLQGLRS